ncbi:DUF1254 domain-containing protein [Nitrosococcus watsonii]|uniref:DUF1254 domain-containing protein n=1 Tax=Nitrosococcus watsoni (strain C-113) TaxID=105559 RepID=D8K8R9_NITWC|nr:DUF1254 domain-containing protein [Nitrosococcus watsonii]ADJ27129.1 protein of unknown function DUF1254 [Nitrosococcus watsonii C-113]
MKKIILLLGYVSVLMVTATQAMAQPVTSAEAKIIAKNVYIYAYPLVMMRVSSRVNENVVTPDGTTAAPINQWGHAKAFPDPDFTVVVRPNADTLYSSLTYNVTKEPLVISVPASKGRYYLLPILDEWSDVFAAPGTRTTGNGALTFAIVGPSWHGKLPAGVREYRSPTGFGWIGGRVQTNGKIDYAAVHKFQDGLKAMPLSHYGQSYTPPKGKVDPNLDMSAPPDQIDEMSAATFFGMFAELMKTNPPHANDYPILDQMRRIGIIPGKSFSLAAATPKFIQDALENAPKEALPLIKTAWSKAGMLQNGWRTNLTDIGTYGTSYLARAAVAYGGLGANTPQDAVYPTAFAASDGRPFDSSKRYVLHFSKAQIPPVNGFWSLAMYNERQLFAPNSINRYALGDRDKLKFNADGSLDIYIQRNSPGEDKEANWLPTPQGGAFTMNLRLYWPKPAVVDGSWAPPPVKRVE